ncbi:MAG: hypothetical protein B6I38_10795 [Anaerolineaceae bacterium 4572_5.1]|nr:MAG: hypothetical protein B6I38_10795 [Anaerolineaceae bacterium 4572_5.1]
MRHFFSVCFQRELREWANGANKGQRLVPAQLGDHTVRAASTPVRDGKGTPLHFEKIHMKQ